MIKERVLLRKDLIAWSVRPDLDLVLSVLQHWYIFYISS